MKTFDLDTLTSPCKSMFDHWRKAAKTETNRLHQLTIIKIIKIVQCQFFQHKSVLYFTYGAPLKKSYFFTLLIRCSCKQQITGALPYIGCTGKKSVFFFKSFEGRHGLGYDYTNRLVGCMSQVYIQQYKPYKSKLKSPNSELQKEEEEMGETKRN